jgi:GMP synthase (glutamine-hydrolysing)
MPLRVIVFEYDEHRSKFVLQHWFPEARVVRRHEAEQVGFAELMACDLLILSGGRWTPYDDKQFLIEDQQMLVKLAECRDESPKVLGICLGAQLMAAAFGGTVETKGEMVLGWNHIRLHADHPAFAGLSSLLQLEIHGNHIAALPASAQLLASSEKDAVEVFSIGDRFLGTAYHPEITIDDIDWFRETQDLHIGNIISDTSHSLVESRVASRTFFANVQRWSHEGPSS